MNYGKTHFLTVQFTASRLPALNVRVIGKIKAYLSQHLIKHHTMKGQWTHCYAFLSSAVDGDSFILCAIWEGVSVDRGPGPNTVEKRKQTLTPQPPSLWPSRDRTCHVSGS
jgi:hypothetical protein